MKIINYLIFGALITSLIGAQITYASIFCIGGGGLSITSVPTDIDFGNVEVSTANNELSLTFPDSIYFEDMRGIIIKKTVPRFSLYVTATDLEDITTGKTIDVTEMNMATDENDVVEIEDCSPQTKAEPQLTELTSFTDSDDNGTSDNMMLIIGQDPTSIIGPSILGAETKVDKLETILKGTWRSKWTKFLNIYVGKYSFKPEMLLNIPAYTSTGTYHTTLTFTII